MLEEQIQKLTVKALSSSLIKILDQIPKKIKRFLIRDLKVKQDVS